VSRRFIVTAALAAGLGLVAVGCSAGQVTQTDTQVAAVDGASGNAGPIAVRNAMLAFPADGNRYKDGEDVPLTFVIANTGSTPDKLLSIKTDASEAEAEVVGSKDLPAQYALRAEYDASKAPAKTSAPSSSAASSSSVVPTSGVPSSNAGTPSSNAGTPSSNSGTPSSGVSSTGTPSSGAPSSGASSAASSTGRPSNSSAAPTAVDPDLEVLQIRCTLKKLNREVVAAQTIKITFLFEKAGSLTLEVPMAPSDHKRTSENHESGGH
jgi:copper(I)-binding protein